MDLVRVQHVVPDLGAEVGADHVASQLCDVLFLLLLNRRRKRGLGIRFEVWEQGSRIWEQESRVEGLVLRVRESKISC